MPDDTVAWARTAFSRERVAAWLLVAGLAVLAVAMATGVGEQIATNTPEATVDADFDPDSGTLTIAHERGEIIGARETTALTVTITDAEAGHERTVTWVGDGPDGLEAAPVKPGDEIRIDDPTVDADDDGSFFEGDATVGFPLTAGDTVVVRWRGRPLGAPGERTVVLGRFELTDSGTERIER